MDFELGSPSCWLSPGPAAPAQNSIHKSETFAGSFETITHGDRGGQIFHICGEGATTIPPIRIQRLQRVQFPRKRNSFVQIYTAQVSKERPIASRQTVERSDYL